MQVFFSAIVTVRSGAEPHEPHAMVPRRLSRPLNLLLEPRAPQHCGFCGHVDFITFLPVLARPSPGSPPRRLPDHRPFYSALISAGVVYALSAAVICRDGNDNSLLDFLVRLARHEPRPVPRARLMDDTKQRDEERREDDSDRHALATGRNLPRSDRDYRARNSGAAASAKAPFS